MLIETANVISTPDKSATTGFPTSRAGLLLSSVMLSFYNWLNGQTLDLNDTGYHILGLGAAQAEILVPINKACGEPRLNSY
jgi:hypothetical protein